MITFEDVVKAYYTCRNNKRNTYSALNFEINLEENLLELYEEIVAREYKPSRSICFVVRHPKYREVWAAQFRDRVVHHIIFNEINPYWSKRWSADTCASIVGRGVLYGANRLHNHIRSYTENWTQEKWYIKADLANFFNSIDKDILWGLLEPSLSSNCVRYLAHKVLYNNPTENGIYLSSKEVSNKIPKRKRLSLAGHNKGLPIGNHTSQIFANVLLNELDQYIKRVLRVPKYVRYVDDLVMLAPSREQACEYLSAVKEFAPSIGVSFNTKKCFIHRINRGVHFVGHSFYPHRWVPLKDTVDRSLERLYTHPESIDSYISLFDQSKNSYNLIKNTLEATGLDTRVNWREINE